MKKLSAVIISFNEEEKIERCIKSLQQVADEILVLDSFSTDRTQQIVKSLNARLEVHKFHGYIEQKNIALSLATYNNIISLDADEVLSPELQQSIQKEKEKDFPFAGYNMNRLTFIGDKPIKCCGWYPDKKIRLFNKTLGQWKGTNPHDEYKFHHRQPVKHLNGDILHYSFKDIGDLEQQTHRFAAISAAAYREKKKRTIPFVTVLSPGVRFFKDYFLKKGYLYGKTGFRIAYFNSLGTKLKYQKLNQLIKDNKQNLFKKN